MAISVLIVDDSALVRAVLTEIINQAPDMNVVGVAKDAFVARDLVNKFEPDVITLDIQMPQITGLVFLERLMRARPTPVVMVSTLTAQGASETLQALELGAVDYIEKPKVAVAKGLEGYQAILQNKIRAAAQAKLPSLSTSAKDKPAPPPAKVSNITHHLIALGASTGGTEALKEVLRRIPASFPPIVITQHMPVGFTKTFSDRLNGLCNITVKEAEDGERILPNTAYIARGDRHLTLETSGKHLLIKFVDGELMSGHKPSVDMMFNSVAKVVGNRAVGVLMTGMGKDGAAGLLAMKKHGAKTFAQDEDTCIVYGMPKEAMRIGAATRAIPLTHIANRIADAVKS